jgi:hypothetical protein
MNYEKYPQSFNEHKDKEWDEFFFSMAQDLSCSFSTVYNIWYANQRSWFKPDMVEALIKLEKEPDAFQPHLISGDFDWDDNTKRFVPDAKERENQENRWPKNL